MKQQEITCDNCGNQLTVKQPFCHKCLSELAKYPISETSETRAKYELKILNGLPEQDQERFQSYRTALETKLFMIQTNHI